MARKRATIAPLGLWRGKKGTDRGFHGMEESWIVASQDKFQYRSGQGCYILIARTRKDLSFAAEQCTANASGPFPRKVYFWEDSTRTASTFRTFYPKAFNTPILGPTTFLFGQPPLSLRGFHWTRKLYTPWWTELPARSADGNANQLNHGCRHAPDLLELGDPAKERTAKMVDDAVEDEVRWEGYSGRIRR